MKLLSFLNLSNESNLLADSGFVFQDILLRELETLGFHTLLVAPVGASQFTNIDCLEIEFPKDKYSVRFNFDLNSLPQQLEDLDFVPDAILVNQGELTVQIASLLNLYFCRKIPAVTYFHYLPVEARDELSVHLDPSLNAYNLAMPIWRTLVTSAIYSNACIIGSKWGVNLFQNLGPDEEVHKKFSVIPPPVEPLLMGDSHRNQEEGKEKVILYNHRLYDHYGTLDLVDWLEEYYERTRGFDKLLITNPTFGRMTARTKLDDSTETIAEKLSRLPFVDFVHCKSREQYREVIERADIGLSPLRRGALWSMAVADMMALGLPVLVYDSGAYPEMVPDEDLIFRGKNCFFKKLDRVLHDKNYRLEKGRIARQTSQSWRPDRIARDFANVFHSL